MPTSIRGNTIDAAIRNDDDMRRLLQGVAYKMAIYDRQLGIFDGFIDDPLTVPEAKHAPPPAAFTVTGVDGKFEIQITLPQDTQPQTVTLYRARCGQDFNRTRALIVHQLQSATNMLFDASGNVTTYGPTPETSLSITNPNVTLFWRLRSSYDEVNWNDWQIYSSASACGPIGVSSGFLRSTSAASNMALNTSNNCTADSIDNGANATVRVYGPGGPGNVWIHYDGQGGQTSYPYSTTPAPYNTDVIVLYSASQGLQAFLIATQYTSSLVDDLIFSGKMHTVSTGGGGGSSGGGGGSRGGGGGGRGLVL